MPDEWESKQRLNPRDLSDGARIAPAGDGYTHLELYLDSLVLPSTPNSK